MSLPWISKSSSKTRRTFEVHIASDSHEDLRPAARIHAPTAAAAAERVIKYLEHKGGMWVQVRGRQVFEWVPVAIFEVVLVFDIVPQE